MPKVAIIGTTTWGTSLAVMLARQGTLVKLWSRTEAEALALNQARENSPLLPGITFPECLSATSNIQEALTETALAIWAVPAQTIRQNVKVATDYLEESTILMSAAKGLEIGTGLRMSQVMTEEVSHYFSHNICVLSGPNLSHEIARGLPAATVVASEDNNVIEQVQRIFTTYNFHIFTSNDVIGVELGGALKNIIALGAGMADGLELGDNAKAAFITLGWTEITTLGVALGADPLTFSGLAGLGDLITTCASSLSRNHYMGREIARGRTLSDVMATTPHVAEGVTTLSATRDLAQRYGLEIPIAEIIYQVLFENLDPLQAMTGLLAFPIPALPTHKV